MNIFSKKLILAVAGALLLFSTGCATKKASRDARPTPDQTLLNGGSAVDTSSSSIGNYGTSGYGTSYGTETSTFTSSLTEHNQPSGDLVGNELRNVPELQSIYFGFDRSAIDKNERSKFQAIKDYLAKNPQYRIIFEGHCDWRGTAEYNMALGSRRASSAKKYATTIGIDPAKVDVRSKGSTQAVERGSEEVMAKDRRAEIVVLVK
ncbi:peptidoglycan-associated lipoprotein [Ereboglobus sp. PH5-10]|uniref:OmpA family protein n=1 Tax=Ereboglobus sp. PH5-10 TaxID=2940629 RepID=UPI002406CB10|nr:OmpA family protein [Ereboglobus sp. PH5-10]MDF9826991.1 peptidoglycan-associated lipoprotein [Ereboglobus sp. PH5-10]